MAAAVTAEWLTRQREATAALPERPGASARIEFTVTGGAEGPVVFHTVLSDGRIAENALGPDPEADFTMTMPAATFAEVAAGTLDLDVGFMQGRIKVAGDLGRMLSVLPVTTTDAWRDATVAAGST